MVTPFKVSVIGRRSDLMVFLLKAVSKLPEKDLTISSSDFGQIKPIGLELYNNWIIAFELISILLLVALIGSVVLAKKRKAKELN